MAERWLYYIPCAISAGGEIGFIARILETDHALNTEEGVRKMIVGIREGFIEQHESGDDTSIIPLGWTLITAQRGAAVGAKDNGGAPPASTRKGEQHG